MALQNPQSETRNPQSEVCPSAEELERFLRAVSDADEHTDIAAHLSACERCRVRAEQLSEHAAWADQLRRANRVRAETAVDVNVPLARLNELLSEYEVIEEIGRGGMGIVFKARHVQLDRMVALKVLPALLGTVRPDAVGRFEREATLLARLQHTNIIPVFDYGQVDGTLYYTMPLIEGRSLRDILREITATGAIDVVLEAGSSADAASPVPSSQPSAISEKQEATRQRDNGATSKRHEAEGLQAGSPEEARRHEGKPTSLDRGALRQGQANIRRPTSITRIGSSSRSDRAYFRRVAKWIADVAEALDYAHEQGVIHRDVKPSNLLLANDGRLMISDFGLARARGMETLTATRSLLGTARYMSPEQADESRGPLDRRVDVYGLGSTLYELLAFRPMFAAADDREVLDSVLNKEPARPRRFVRQVPRELETICLKAVQKEREARYETAKAMADDLRRWLLDMPINARRPSPLVRAAKFARRRKLPVALGVVAVGLVIVAGVLYGGYHSSRRQEAQTRAVAESRGLELARLEARALLEEGRYAACLEKTSEALGRWPDTPELLGLRANALGHMGRDQEALQCLEGILERDPDDWRTHYLLASVYAYRPARREGEAAQTDRTMPWAGMSQGEIDAKTEYHTREVQRLMPETAEAFYVQACTEEDPRRALALLNKALELEPDRFDFIYDRARQYYKLEQYDAMLLDAERAVTLRDGWAMAHAQRGLALMGLERYEDAIAAYSRAIELDPKKASHWLNRASSKMRVAKFAESIADASEAIRLDPQYALPYAVRGRARAGLGDLEEGLRDCSRAIELNPSDVPLYAQRLALYAQAARWEDVIADASVMIQFRPRYFAGYEHRAIALLNAERPERAISDCGHLINLRPDYARGFRIRAIAHTRTGQLNKAIDDYTRAIEIAPDASPDISDRAKLYLRTGRFADAVSDLTRLASLEPRKPTTLIARGMAYELAGALKLAAADYDRAALEDGPTGEYARLWRYLLLRGSGHPDAAADVLAARESVAGTSSWTDRLFDLFTGQVTPENLLAAAVTDDERAEAHCYIGRKALLDGKTGQARDAFTRCVDLKRSGILETDFARALLKQLAERSRPAENAP